MISKDSEAEEKLPDIDRGHTYPMPLWLQLIRWLRGTLLLSIAANGAVLILTVIIMLAVVEADAFSIPWKLRDALDEYTRLFLVVASLVGLFGLAVVFALVHDLYWAFLRWHLGRFTDDASNRRQVPVDWQRSSYGPDDDSSSVFALYPGFTVLSLFGYVMGPIVALVAIMMIVQDDDREFALIVLPIGVLLVLVPLVVRWVLKRVPESRSKGFWGNVKAGRFEPRRQKRASSPEVEALVRRADVTGKVADALVAIAAVSFLPTMAATFVMQPCNGCEPRDLSALGESFVGFLAGSASWIAVLTLVPLLVAFLLDSMVKYRLRQQLLAEAAAPEAKMPPWPVLNGALLEEAPLIRFFMLSHVVGLVLLEIGVTGLLLDDSALAVDDGTWWMLCRAGAGLIAFGAVFWWLRRDKVAEERELLMKRWGHT